MATYQFETPEFDLDKIIYEKGDLKITWRYVRDCALFGGLFFFVANALFHTPLGIIYGALIGWAVYEVDKRGWLDNLFKVKK